MKNKWKKDLAEVWTNIVSPSRPSPSEICLYNKYLHIVRQRKRGRLKLLVLGSTPEFRDWGYDEDMDITVVDESEEYYRVISREIRHKNLKENVLFCKWEEMFFEESFDIIIGDLAIGNVNPCLVDVFFDNIERALSDEGFFIGKSFIWDEHEEVKTPTQIIQNYKTSTHIHPYTFINHQLGFYCLNKNDFSISFSKMFKEVEKLYKTGIIDEGLFSYFSNVGWDKEMKFNFYAPSQKLFIEIVNKKLQFECFEHTDDIYTNLFPIYIVTKKKKGGQI